MTKRSTYILFTLLLAFPLTSESGREIMQKLKDAKDPLTSHALVRMELIDTDNSIKERIIEEWSANDEQGMSNSVIVFHRPASVAGTRFLVKENPDRDDDQWIYLPALKKVRRIAASEGGDSFMGTEFSYDDMKSREIDDYTHTYLRDENSLGYECSVVESVPAGNTESQYGRIVHWITKDEEVMTDLKLELYDKGGRLSKVFTVEELQMIDGYWTAVSVIMKNVQTGKATRLIQQQVELDKPINPRRFTSRYLQTGRTE